MVIPGLLILITQTTQEGINEPAKETPLLTSALVQFSHTHKTILIQVNLQMIGG